MRLRWLLIPLGVLAVAAAVFYYFAWLPPQLADDYEKAAEPQHLKVEEALRPVTATFNDTTVGTIKFERKDPRAYLRAYLSVAARDQRELGAARREVRRARRALARVDEGDLTDPPSWPLLDGRGDMDKANAVAADERTYLRKARAFLKAYDQLLAYETQSNRWIDRVNLSYAREETKIPKTPTSPGQITGPLNRAVRGAAAGVRGLRKLKPPRTLRTEHRRLVKELELDVRRQRAISEAVARDDFTRVRAVERQVKRDHQKADRNSRKDLRRLVERSPYRRQIQDLERLEVKIFDAFQDL